MTPPSIKRKRRSYYASPFYCVHSGFYAIMAGELFATKQSILWEIASHAGARDRHDAPVKLFTGSNLILWEIASHAGGRDRHDAPVKLFTGSTLILWEIASHAGARDRNDASYGL